MGIADGRAEELESPFFMSLLMVSDSGDDTGISLNDWKWLIIGVRSGKKDNV